jgi:hydroxyacylglutathione hydrolase
VDVVPVSQLQDNYAYLIVDPASREAAVVDCAEAGPVLQAARHAGARLTTVLATHHHYDHVGGNDDLRAAIPDVRIFGSAEDAPRIPGITNPVRDGETVTMGGLTARVIFIPAHTSGHVAYYFEKDQAVFTGDTLFAGGCGRLFEGDAAQMMSSLGRLAKLPDATRVFCGHEYTQKNLEFAVSLEPGNTAVVDKLAHVRALRAARKPTIPSTIAEEKATNPFLRTSSAELSSSVRAKVPGLASNDPVALFAAVRTLKDRF